MKDRFLRKILPQIHTLIAKNFVDNNINGFFIDPDKAHTFEVVSSEIMTKLAMTEEKADELLGYLYYNLQMNPEDYENIESFRKPTLEEFKIDKDQFWTVRDTETFSSNAYFPSMAGFLTVNDEAKSVGKLDLEWVNLDDTRLTLPQ